MHSFRHVRLRTVRNLGDQSIRKNTEAGGLEGYSVGHWVLSKFRRKRNDPRLPGRVPPSQDQQLGRKPTRRWGRTLEGTCHPGTMETGRADSE